MKIKKYPLTKMNQLNELVYTCFKDDHFYHEMYGDRMYDRRFVYDLLSPLLWASLICGNIYGAMEYGDLIGFMAFVDYYKVKENANQRLYSDVFPQEYKPLEKIFNEKVEGNFIYPMLIGVAPKERRRGIASAMLDKLIEEHPGDTIATNVSNELTLPMYERRGFHIEKLSKGYYFVKLAPGR